MGLKLYGLILPIFFVQLTHIFSTDWQDAANKVYTTNQGKRCAGRCWDEGTSYRWCNTRDSSWGYCSTHERHDTYSAYCTSPCVVDSSGYFTCGNGNKCGTIEKNCPLTTLSTVKPLQGRSEFAEGNWGDTEYCPENEFVVGFQLLSQRFLGRGNDDRGVVGIKFFCSNSSENITSSSACPITSDFHVVRESEWTRPQFCAKGFANKFELKTWTSQGVYDDLGVTNFRLHCSDGKILTNDLNYEPGEWPKAPHECDPKTYICSIKTKIEMDHDNDNTGLNAVDVSCCAGSIKALQKAAADCELKREWVEVFRADNRNGSSPLKKTFREKIGITKSDGTRSLDKGSKTIGRDDTWGIENEFTAGNDATIVKNTLKLKFEQKFSTSSTTEQENERSWNSAFEKESEHTTEIEILPGWLVSIRQLVYNCGQFDVYPNVINRTDIYRKSDTEVSSGSPLEKTTIPAVPSLDYQTLYNSAHSIPIIRILYILEFVVIFELLKK